MFEQLGPDLILVERLASSSMAEVFSARFRASGGFEKPVAVKKIRPEVLENFNLRQGFLQEIQLVSQLQHPNIVQVFHTGEVGGQVFLVMELVEGKSIEQLLLRLNSNQGELPIPLACYIVEQVARGLVYAHELRDSFGHACCVLHGDLNPRNVIVSYQGDVKLVDFGLAWVVVEGGQNQVDKSHTTIRYGSPEQLGGGTVNACSDIFSLGLLAYELLTGRRPSPARFQYNFGQLDQTVSVEPPSYYRSEISSELDQIVINMLAVDAAKRTQTAREVRQQVRSIRKQHYRGFRPEELGPYLREVFALDLLREGQRKQRSAAHIEMSGWSSKSKHHNHGKWSLFLVVGFGLVLLGFILLWWWDNSSEQVLTDLGVIMDLRSSAIDEKGGERVVKWRASVGVGLDAIQPVLVHQPHFRTPPQTAEALVVFDGQNDYMRAERIAEHLSLFTSTTIVASVTLDVNDGGGCLITLSSSTGLEPVARLCFDRDRILLFIGAQKFVSEPLQLEPEQLASIIVLINQQDVAISFRGRKVLASHLEQPPFFGDIQEVSIGQGDGHHGLSEFWSGGLSRFLLFDHALSEREMEQLKLLLGKS